MKRPDVLAVMIVLGVVALGVIGLVADSFSGSNVAGQAMYVKGYTAAVKEVKTDYKIEQPIQQVVATPTLTEPESDCDCPDDDEIEVSDDNGLEVVTAVKRTIEPITTCTENDWAISSRGDTLRHNNPRVQETVTIKRGSTVLRSVKDSCILNRLVQLECNPDDPENPTRLSEYCETECRFGRCASEVSPPGSCREFEYGAYSHIDGRFRRYLANSCANRKILVEVGCDLTLPGVPVVWDSYTVCDGECRTRPLRLTNGETTVYGYCV